MQEIKREKAESEKKLQEAEQQIKNLDEENKIALDFKNQVEEICKAYPPEKRNLFKSVIENYTKTGEFQQSQIDKLEAKPKGIIARIREYSQMKKANQAFAEFKEKVEKDKPFERMEKSKSSVKYIFKRPFNNETSFYKEERRSFVNDRDICANRIKNANERISSKRKEYERNREKENEIIRAFAEQKSKKRKPQQRN